MPNTKFENFIANINKEIKQYNEKGVVFSMFLLEFKVTDELICPYRPSEISGFIARIINQYIRANKDSYVIENPDKFMMLFPECPLNLAFIMINKITNEIKQELGSFVNTDISMAEYPQNGTTVTGLIDYAKQTIKTFKKSDFNLLSISPTASNTIQEEIDRSLFVLEKSIKTVLFKELNRMLKRIAQYDPYLGGHSALVTRGAVLLAKEMNLPQLEIEKITVASFLHDIGYTAIPKEIFQKNGPLLPEEMRLIKLHPSIACEQILKPIKLFDEHLPLIQNHHEFLDGSGYPRGKKGDEIPLGAQIISIVDSYQAMSVDRPYRKAVSFEEIIDVYIKSAGIKWDNTLITIFTAMIADETTRNQIADSKLFDTNY